MSDKKTGNINIIDDTKDEDINGNENNYNIARININEDNYYTLTGDYGTFNLEVKDGQIKAIDVECPNQICVHTGWISKSYPFPIICIPNNIVVTIDE